MDDDQVNDRLREWLDLADRLLRASPAKWEEVTRLIRQHVEGQELLAAADNLLVLRGQRPSKRYRA